MVNLKNKIDDLILLYEKYFEKWNSLRGSTYNFSKQLVRDFKDKVNWLEDVIELNYSIINEIKEENNFSESLFTNTINRIKNYQSIHEKIDRYYNNNDKGTYPLKKCLNDFLGFRYIIDSNLDFIFQEIEDYCNSLEILKDVKTKRLRISKGEYNAIHIYISKSNNCLPWELQIWDKKDALKNDEAHFKKYGRY